MVLGYVFKLENLENHKWNLPLTLAEWFKAYAILNSSSTGVISSNPDQGIDIYVGGIVILLIVIEGLAMDRLQGVQPDVHKYLFELIQNRNRPELKETKICYVRLPPL
jgi:hypothetical protein